MYLGISVLPIVFAIGISILCSISRNLGTFLKNSEQISYQKIQIISELLGHVMLQLSRMLVWCFCHFPRGFISIIIPRSQKFNNPCHECIAKKVRHLSILWLCGETKRPKVSNFESHNIWCFKKFFYSFMHIFKQIPWSYIIMDDFHFVFFK